MMDIARGLKGENVIRKSGKATLKPMKALTAIFLIASLALVVPSGSLIARSADDKQGKVLVGLLEVYTGTKTYNSGNILYFPHTSYSIHHANGKFYRYVRNHTTPTDEVPFRILIPAGHYFILARSEKEGRVKVPVTIDPGRARIIRLDDPNQKRIPSDSKVIRLKDGSVAGWCWSRKAPPGFSERRGQFNIFGWKI
jgi:hypothetical protein